MSADEIRELELKKKELQALRLRIKERRVDSYYVDVDKERKQELAEKVVQKKRLYIHNEMVKKDIEAIDDRFN